MDEDVQVKEVDWRLLRRLLVYLRPYRGRLSVAVTLMLVTSNMQVATLVIVKTAIDDCIGKHNLPGIDRISFYYLLIIVAQMVLEYFQVYILQMTGQYVMYDMRVQIFEHLQKLELNFFHRNPVGRLM